jgi:hypothetical protein
MNAMATNTAGGLMAPGNVKIRYSITIPITMANAPRTIL